MYPSALHSIVIGGLMPRVVLAFDSAAPEWLLDRRLWILLAMTLLCPLAFLRKIDSLKFTNYISLCAVGNLVSFRARAPRSFPRVTDPRTFGAGLCRDLQVVHQPIGSTTERRRDLVLHRAQICAELAGPGELSPRALALACADPTLGDP